MNIVWITCDSILATRDKMDMEAFEKAVEALCKAERIGTAGYLQEGDVMVVTSETDRYNSQGTSSFTALAAVFDALQTAVIEETGYKNEQFALIHPAGAVGKRLNK